MATPDLLSLDQAVRAGTILTARMPHVSDCTPASLFLFRRQHRYRLVETPSPHIRGLAYDGTRLVMPLSGAGNADLIGPGDRLYPLSPEKVAKLGAGWRVDHDPGDADYVYRTAKLAGLEGARDRRRQAARFATSGEVALFPLDEPVGIAAARSVLDLWLAESARAEADTDFASCVEAFDQFQPLGLFGIVVRLDDAPVGFVVASAPWPDMAIIHFAKGLRRAPGVHPYMFAAFARRNRDREWTNFEQDLGNPRFRQAKRAFGPERLIAKYRAWPDR